jgi:hypothetical protein
MDVVVTKQNYFRYHMPVDVIPANMPYVVYNDYVINDAAGNGDGILDYGESVLLSLTLENVGLIDALGVSADVNSDNTFITITDNSAEFGDIPSMQTASVTDEYAFDVANDIGDGDIVTFNVEATDGDSTWNSFFTIQAHAPIMEYASFTIDDATGNGNGRLDPGETVQLYINVENTGSSEAYNVDVALSCSGDGYVSVLNGPVNVGDMPAGTDAEAMFNVYAEDFTPGGFLALFNVNINADKDISGNGGFDLIVGQFDALILDLDPNNYSGPSMLEAFNDLDLIASYTTAWPEDLGIYRSVFIPLGIIFTGHVLTPAESNILVEYLNNGGRLYLEGRRTWFDFNNPWLPIHDMFNIGVMEDTWFEYDTIVGVHGTFCDGMLFGYDGVSPYNDYHMIPEGDAFTVLTGTDPDMGYVVAYDEGSYKTIGCAFEFGALVDGTNPSTKAKLMLEYLDFFGDIITDVDEYADMNMDASLGNIYPNPFSDHATLSFTLHEEAPVLIEIYSLDGRRLNTLLDREVVAGEHTVKWYGTNATGEKLSAGIYVITLKTNSVISTRKIILY